MNNTATLPRLRRWVPAIDWLGHYQRRDFRGDLVAGITVAMMLIPQAMSYALLAGLPPYIGLYASVLPLIIYAVFGTSRQLAVGPVAMVALLVSSGVGAMADIGSDRYIALAILLSLMVGAIQFGMGVFRLGFLTNFMSHPVISGFTSAAALIIGFSQLKHIVGLPLPRTENIAETLWLTVSQITDINMAAFAIGVGGVILLLGLKRMSPLMPGAMIAVVLSTLVVWLFDLNTTAGVSVVGEVPAGFPEFSVPSMSLTDLTDLLPIAITISIVGFLESIAVAKKIASQKRYEIDANKELVGLGLANIVGAFFKAMPVTGGFSRTAVNNNAGANTGLAAIITAMLIGFALLFLTPLFYYIPKAILGSVIMVAVFGLIDIHEVKHLWKVKKDDLGLLAFTFLATLILGVKTGIFLAVGLSMVWFVIKTTRPHYAVLGRLPGTDVYRNVKRHSDAETKSNILAIRFDAQFYYGNVSFLKDTIKRAEADMATELKAVVLDASSINQLDSSADTALHELLRDYRLRGVDLFVANVKGPVRDVMERSGFVETLGEDHFFLTTREAMDAAQDYVDQQR
ncbi:SulP family inorganic anion transporter [Saccharospirillum salsuginis]|uniref:Sodium-independent anion transporter n=1 Tax=Saccharospirillum salsuginis TaxID=418750 RepID=A0A918K1I3_9GAMM|nr:solute carrier family 26 protein [Saccharospirillum salsuginis]GGX39885.1 sodium-independent anion transporter [Saccharospirillum salsuginis]